MTKVKSPFLVIAHNIRSLYNVGSIFRTADGFGVSKIFVTGYSGTPEHPKLAKTSLGAEVSMLWEYKKSCVALIKKLKQDYPGIKIIGLENNLPANYRSKRIYLNDFKVPRIPLAMILGEEVNGIPKNVLPYIDQFLEIPMIGKKESLNVAVAFGIAAYCITAN
jgi:23S rRNA (guanosine2251-2'-O)-methyltransferase